METWTRRLRRTSLYLLILLLLGIAGGARPALAAPGTARRWTEDPAVTTRGVGTEPRLALVIGNATYTEHPLKTPDHDARAVVDTLKSLGFSVQVLLNANRNEMRDEFNAFAERIRKSGGNAIALVYYSGYALQIGGKNYLAPIDFQMPDYADDIADSAVSVETALAKVQNAGAAVSIAVLDACRNNPFTRSRSVAGNGLSSLEMQGMCIAFSAAEGQAVPDDAASDVGLYTREWLHYLKTPGLSIHDVFKKTGGAVDDQTQHRQSPALYDGLIHGDQCYLAGQSVIPPDKALPPDKPAPTDNRAALTINCGIPDAVLILDGRSISPGQTLNYFLDAGASKEMLLMTKAPGFRTKRQQITLYPGPTVVDVVLEPDAQPAPTPDTVTPSSNKASPANAPAAKTRTNPIDGAVMIFIPEGPFNMGDDDPHSLVRRGGTWRAAGPNDNPRHPVSLSGYYIYKNLVTVAMYQKFCKAKNRNMPLMRGDERDDQPIVNVSWYDACAYCQWAQVQLPTEAQWEKAARGTDARLYPWGNDFNATLLWSSAQGRTAHTTYSVGHFTNGASPYGVLDMAGNVWQWCLDAYNVDFWTSMAARQKDPVNKNVSPTRVVRGGAWSTTDETFCRTGFRAGAPAEQPGGLFRDSVGFRCVIPAR